MHNEVAGDSGDSSCCSGGNPSIQFKLKDLANTYFVFIKPNEFIPFAGRLLLQYSACALPFFMSLC